MPHRFYLTLTLLLPAQGLRSLPAPLSDFFIPANLTYHNVGTLGPATRAAIDAVASTNAWLESNPDYNYFEFPTNSITKMEAVRAQAAAFFGAALPETALVESTTFALNTVSEGISNSGFIGPLDWVLMTDQEHAGATSGWLHLAALRRIAGVTTVHVPTSWAQGGGGTPVEDLLAAFSRALGNASQPIKVVAVPHVLTTTGVALPLARLAALARAAGALLVVDGAQAPGGLAVDFYATGADVYATSAHKWLLAPKASAVLLVRAAAQPLVRATFLEGGFGAYTGQTGTRSAANFVGLGAALDYLSAFGMGAVEAHNIALRNAAHAGVVALGIPGLLCASPAPDAANSPLWSPLLTVALPEGVTSQAAAKALFTQYGVVVKMTGAAVFPGEWPPGSPPYALRLSHHVFNSEEDVARTIAALGAVVKQLVREGRA